MAELIIALGKNIGIGSSSEDIRQAPDHLSLESRLTVEEAGLVYAKTMDEVDILFAGGPVAGPGVPTEAAAMKAYFMKRWLDVPEDHILTEEVSMSTGENAIEVAKMLEDRPAYRQISLVSVGYHVRNAALLFRRAGVDVTRTYSSTAHYQGYYSSPKVWGEVGKEALRAVLLHPQVDPEGVKLGKLARVFRG